MAPDTSKTDEPKIEDVPLAAEVQEDSLPALGPPNVVKETPKESKSKTDKLPSAADPAALQKAGMSPADLEIAAAPVGKPILVKQNPETPSPHQIGAGITTQDGPPDVTVTVTDADGKEMQHRLGTDDLAQIHQRAAATLATHPAHTTVGYSNPNARALTDEEREADQAAYEKRFGLSKQPTKLRERLKREKAGASK